ncbi:iron-hydroxamate ABC transporter substrate-binding protein [Bacillus sp. 179-C3.3 HS]|uniref:iron-hydroxamate ABC transporter substrate-binding protein n=1 Tax=Bacillus sp. 179-C3.3 HS TaxID=3232162 RepID=UPI00399F122F
MKKLLIFVLTISFLILAACGQQETKKKANENDPETPKIASLSIHLTNNLLALGIKPTGSVVGGELKDFLPHAKEQLKNTKKLGIAADPDMESLLALEPDVIYVDQDLAGQDLSKYKKIAKTEVFNLNEGTWRDHLKKIAKHVNKEKEADQFIQHYDQEAKEVKSLIQNKIGNGKVMAIRVTAKELRVFSMKRPMGPILFKDLGLTPVDGVKKLDSQRPFEVISQEVLPDFDADAIFVVVNRDDKAQQAFKQLEQTPIWKGLKAVKKNQVYPIADQPWLDYSALGNQMAMDEAKEMFSK